MDLQNPSSTIRRYNAYFITTGNHVGSIQTQTHFSDWRKITVCEVIPVIPEKGTVTLYCRFCRNSEGRLSLWTTERHRWRDGDKRWHWRKGHTTTTRKHQRLTSQKSYPTGCASQLFKTLKIRFRQVVLQMDGSTAPGGGHITACIWPMTYFDV